MRRPYHGPSADDYIRSIDRILIVTGTIAVAVAVGLIFQIA